MIVIMDGPAILKATNGVFELKKMLKTTLYTYE